ncbi:hypothetical protein NUW58_g4984 [Xylaria curta]|uniref:Uncharacterized protein n=1 Tax=Xylaria curta TaxID=42375 RepID=A0ACC1P6W1_9PEZI|nr:hypothetical protein NUW58_g4984 [Xylaria curta]
MNQDEQDEQDERGAAHFRDLPGYVALTFPDMEPYHRREALSDRIAPRRNRSSKKTWVEVEVDRRRVLGTPCPAYGEVTRGRRVQCEADTVGDPRKARRSTYMEASSLQESATPLGGSITNDTLASITIDPMARSGLSGRPELRRGSGVQRASAGDGEQIVGGRSEVCCTPCAVIYSIYPAITYVGT